jgi:hypothetical protein
MGMCQGRLCHRVSFCFLLIAVAIQGVTPDAQDLASLKSLLLFCPALANSIDLAGEDGLPDEVCGPAEPDSVLGSRSRTEPNELASKHLGLAEKHNPLLSHKGAHRSRGEGGEHSRPDELIYALCRLRC